MRLKICHLYPAFELYGDRGNILVLTARCCWRGIEPVISQVSLGADPDFTGIDILFIGGSSEREQGRLVQDMKRWEKELRRAVEDGLVVLAIGSGYQMLGRYYQTAGGEKIQGLGILDIWTIAGEERLTGNVVIQLEEKTLVGFENHLGKTYLGEGVRPLGKVLFGHGNNGVDRQEGVRYRNVYGTYLHGPLLPKNPYFADLLLELAIQRRGLNIRLKGLDDRLEKLAHEAMVNKLLK